MLKSRLSVTYRNRFHDKVPATMAHDGARSDMHFHQVCCFMLWVIVKESRNNFYLHDAVLAVYKLWVACVSVTVLYFLEMAALTEGTLVSLLYPQLMFLDKFVIESEISVVVLHLNDGFGLFWHDHTADFRIFRCENFTAIVTSRLVSCSVHKMSVFNCQDLLPCTCRSSVPAGQVRDVAVSVSPGWKRLRRRVQNDRLQRNRKTTALESERRHPYVWARTRMMRQSPQMSR